MAKKLEKSTICVHTGTVRDENLGIISPIYPSTSYDYFGKDYLSYPRYFNTPNQRAVSDKIAALEKAESCLVTGSGMAAISTVLFSLLKQGDHALFQSDIYGGTYGVIVKDLNRFGIEYSFFDAQSIDSCEENIKPNTKIIYLETPSNPLLKITDLKAFSELAKSKSYLTIVDNTFASPINQNPIELGIDIVVHSGTKYLGGHSDISCGTIVSSESLINKFWDKAIHLGGTLNAQSCYLLERSLKTLQLRVNQQNENAEKLARYLESHDQVKNVYYPGLESHPNHVLAKEQMLGFGGMLSFEPDLETSEISDFLKNLNLAQSAISLGGVETIISSPVKTSHSAIPWEERSKLGITDQLLRMSVGIESADDLIMDLEQAFSKSATYV